MVLDIVYIILPHFKIIYGLVFLKYSRHSFPEFIHIFWKTLLEFLQRISRIRFLESNVYNTFLNVFLKRIFLEYILERAIWNATN